MTTSVTFNIEQSKNNKTKATTFTLQTENKAFINSIISLNGDTITEAQMKTLQDKMAVAGDAGILEQADMSPQEKINMAAMTKKYGNKYDIELITENGKQFYKFTIKERFLREHLGAFGGPKREVSGLEIRDAFNLDVKYEQDDLWGHSHACSALTKYNPELWNSYGVISDNDTFNAGTTFKLPVEDVTFNF